MAKQYDVAIIGGGIIGHSTAWHLANKNINIALINTNQYGMAASAAAAGLLTPYQLEELGNPALKHFGFTSYEYFLDFYGQIQNHTNVDLGFRNSGSIYLMFSNSEFAKKEMQHKDLKSIDPNISFLNKHEITQLEPKITKEIVGAYSFPGEAYINNPKFLKGINQYLIDKNVSILNSSTKEIIITNNRIEKAVLGNGETITADQYVLCNGVWANKFLNQIFKPNETLIKAIKGEILQLNGFQGSVLSKIVFCQEGYVVPRPTTNQFETASVLVGSTSEEIDLAKNTGLHGNTLSGIQSLTKLFNKLFPEIKDCQIQNHWSGLRPQTKDAMPIISQVDIIQNLYLGLGHYRNGILMGPYTGKILCDLLENKKPEFDISPFKVERLLTSNYAKALS